MMYQDTSLDPSTAARTISFSFSDPNATVNAGTDNVSVTAVDLIADNHLAGAAIDRRNVPYVFWRRARSQFNATSTPMPESSR